MKKIALFLFLVCATLLTQALPAAATNYTETVNTDKCATQPCTCDFTVNYDYDDVLYTFDIVSITFNKQNGCMCPMHQLTNPISLSSTLALDIRNHILVDKYKLTPLQYPDNWGGTASLNDCFTNSLTIIKDANGGAIATKEKFEYFKTIFDAPKCGNITCGCKVFVGGYFENSGDAFEITEILFNKADGCTCPDHDITSVDRFSKIGKIAIMQAIKHLGEKKLIKVPVPSSGGIDQTFNFFSATCWRAICLGCLHEPDEADLRVVNRLIEAEFVTGFAKISEKSDNILTNYVLSNSFYLWRPCNGQACCEYKVTVEWEPLKDANGNMIVDKDGKSVGSTPIVVGGTYSSYSKLEHGATQCTTPTSGGGLPPRPVDLTGCEPVCDKLVFGRHEVPAIIQSAGKSLELVHNYSPETTCAITPNPNSGDFILHISGGETSRLVLHIFDLNGKVLQELSIVKDGREYEKNIRLTGITSGIYRYLISDINGNSVYSGKIQVVK